MDFLRREGLNVTRSRLTVLQVLAQLPRHFEASELWQALRPLVSPATVYRTLGLLERAGLVRKVEFGEAHAHYERTFGWESHGSLVCRVCGKVWEFPVEGVGDAVEEIAQAQGFSLREVVIQGHGVCPRCQAEAYRRV